MSINSVNISGNLTRDPDYRQSQGGQSILNFGVAVNDRRKNPQTGQWEDYANFVDCVLFGNRADSLSGILRKGMKVMVNGKLHYSSWEKDGQKRSKLEVIANDVDLPPKGSGQQRGYAQQQGYAQQPAYGQPSPQPTYGAPAPLPTQPTFSAPAPYQQQAPAPAPAPAPMPQQQQMGFGSQPAQQPFAGVYDEDIPF